VNVRDKSAKQGVKTRKITSSQYAGVNWNKQAKKWASSLYAVPRDYYLGMFTSEIEAAKAYNAKAFELYGENARLNTIKDLK